MSHTLPPPPPRSPPAHPSQPAPAAPSSASAPQAPAAVRALPPGVTVEVTVTASNRGGAEVRLTGTDTRFTLRTTLPPMPDGTRLTLQVTGQHTEATALRVTEVGGRPLSQALPDMQARAAATQAEQTSPTTARPSTPTAPQPHPTATGAAGDSLSLSHRDGLLAIVLRDPAGGRPPAPQPTQAQPQQPATQSPPAQQQPPAQQPSQTTPQPAQPAPQPTQGQPQQPATQGQPTQQQPPAQQPSQTTTRPAQPAPQPTQAQPQQPATQGQLGPLPAGQGGRPMVINGVTLQPGAAVLVRVAAISTSPPGASMSAATVGPSALNTAASAAPPSAGAGAQAAPPPTPPPTAGTGPAATTVAPATPAGQARPQTAAGAAPQSGSATADTQPAAPLLRTAEEPARGRTQQAPTGRPGETVPTSRGHAASPLGQEQVRAAAGRAGATSKPAAIAAYGGAKGPLAARPTPWVSSAPSQPNPASLLQGTVLPGRSAEQTLVRTPAGTLSIAGRIAAPPGASVRLEVLRPASLPTPAPTVTAGGPLGAPVAFSATVWPSMTDALSLLGQLRGPGGTQAAQQFTVALPRADGQMTAAVAAFLGAVKAGGEARAWPGSGVMKALETAGERGRATARQISRDVADAAFTRRDASGAEWRVTTLPFHADAEVQKIQLITRRPGTGDDEGSGEGDGGRKGGGQRFLVNLELSRLGLMQIDGLVRKVDKRFDLIIRTHAPLPQHMRRDMVGLFANAVSALGLKGGLSFNVTPRFETPVPDPDAPRDRPGLFA